MLSRLSVHCPDQPYGQWLPEPDVPIQFSKWPYDRLASRAYRRTSLLYMRILGIFHTRPKTSLRRLHLHLRLTNGTNE